MDFNSFIQNFKAEMCTSEKVALQSMHDFFESSSEQYYKYVEVIQKWINLDDHSTEALTNFMISEGYPDEKDVVLTVGNHTDTLRNILRSIGDEAEYIGEAELTFTALDGSTYSVDELLIGINDYINANIALSEGTQALASATADTISNQATSFFQNLNLRVNDISGAVSETAYSLSNLIQDKNLPWRDKFRYIMDISGISKLLDPNTSDAEALNFSDSFSNQMTGTSPLLQTVNTVVEKFDELPTIEQVGAVLKTAAYYIWVKPFELWWKGVTWVGNKIADTAKIAFNPNDINENDKYDDQTIDNLGMGFRISFRSIDFVSTEKLNGFKDKLSTTEYICLSFNPATLYVWKENDEYFNLLVKLHPVSPWAQTNLQSELEAMSERLQGGTLSETDYDYLGNLFGKINYQANNFSSTSETDVLQGIQAAKNLLAQNAIDYYTIKVHKTVDRIMYEGVANMKYYNTIPNTVTNLVLAEEMTRWGSSQYNQYVMTDGSQPIVIDEQYGLNLDDGTVESVLYCLIYYIIDSLTSSDQYCPYIRINSQLKGRISVKTDSENVDAFNKLLIGIAIVVAVVAAVAVTGKVITGMRKSALKASTDLASYKQRMNLRVMKGRPLTNENIDELYKLTKKANFLSKLTKGFCSSTSDILSTSLLSLDSLSSSNSKNISNIMESNDDMVDLINVGNQDIKELITG